MPRSSKNKYLRSTSRRKKRSASLSRIFLLLLFTGLIATVLYVWVRVRVFRQQVIIAELEDRVRELETSNEYLRMESLRLSTTDHLQSIAEKYGFTYPNPDQVVRLAK